MEAGKGIGRGGGRGGERMEKEGCKGKNNNGAMKRSKKLRPIIKDRDEPRGWRKSE